MPAFCRLEAQSFLLLLFLPSIAISICALMQAGNIATPEMYRTFNMGVGMVVIVSPSDVEQALATDNAAFVLGSVVSGDEVQIV